MEATIHSQQPTATSDNQCTYEMPAIIYEGVITTRAGSPVGGPDKSGVDPADIFGTND